MRPRDRTRFFYVSPRDLHSPVFRFPDEEAGHILQVLRLVSGDLVTVVDGEGNGAVVRLRLGGRALRGEVIERFRSSVEPAVRLVLGVGLVRGPAMDEIVERAGEMGVSAVVPLLAGRSVPRGEAVRAGGKVERWTRLGRSGMKVARGAIAPEIRPPVGLEEFLGDPRRPERIFLLRREAPPLPRGAPPGPLVLLVGPEGGFTGEEEGLALGAGASPRSLGPRNLRTGTACAAALSLLLGESGPGAGR
jgi:16S rRNA (uracil1498-N3)-methyltransferase